MKNVIKQIFLRSSYKYIGFLTSFVLLLYIFANQRNFQNQFPKLPIESFNVYEKLLGKGISRNVAVNVSEVAPVRMVNIWLRYLTLNDVCLDDDVKAVIIVVSDPRTRQYRDLIRSTLSQEELRYIGYTRVFVFGNPDYEDGNSKKNKINEAIAVENAQFHDLIQGDFVDNYNNLTYFEALGLQWAVTYCPQAKHIIKMDDDIAVDMYRIKEMVDQLPTNDVFHGQPFIGRSVIRDKKNKWYIPPEQYDKEIYPDFLHGTVTF